MGYTKQLTMGTHGVYYKGTQGYTKGVRLDCNKHGRKELRNADTRFYNKDSAHKC